jgi:hypothetical protein
MLAGFVLVIHLNLPLVVRILLTVVWLVVAAYGMLRQGGGYRAVRRLRLDRHGAGNAEGNEGRLDVRVLEGSVLLQRCLWLRLRIDNRLVYGELVLASDLGEADWRRMHRLWRYGLIR